MQPVPMSECRPHQQARPVISPARRPGACDRLLIGLVALSLVRAGEALAGEQGSQSDLTGRHEPGDVRQSTILLAPMFDAPKQYSISGLADTHIFSKDEFRPRGHSVFESDAHADFGDDNLIDDTTVWQRLTEFRFRDRVRVLTLWESGLSSVSLQAGKRGDPSLQWSSRMMNSGGPSHGLLDRWIPASTSAGNSAAGVAHPMAHSANPQPSVRGEPAGKAAASSAALRQGLP